MPNIPDAIPLDSLQGEMPSTATLAPTDFGLGRVADEVGQVATMQRRTSMLQIRAQAYQDKQAAMPTILQAQAANADDYQTAVAAGHAADPTFVSDQVDNARQRASRILGDPNLTPGQASEAYQGALAHANAIGEAALNAHAAALAQPIAEARQAQNAVDTGNGLIAYQGAMGPAVSALQNGYVEGAGNDTAYIAAVGKAHDDAAAAAIAAAPPAVQPQLQMTMAQEKLKAVGDAQSFVLKHAQTALVSNLDSQVSDLATNVYQTPSGYDDAVSTLETQASAVPAGLRQAYLDDGNARLADARLKALTENGHADQAQRELASGKYDGILTDKEIESYSASAAATARANAPTTTQQAVDQDNARLSVSQNLEALASTGVAPTMDAATLAKLPQEERASYLATSTLARQQVAATGPIHQMATADLTAIINAPPPTDTTNPTYPAEVALQKARVAAAQTELQARQKDPAAASAAYDTHNAPLLAADWAAIQSQTGAVQAKAGVDYAGRVLGMQQGRGIPANARTVFQAGQVQGLVSAVNDAPPEAKQAALTNLAGVLAALPTQVRLNDGTYQNPRAIAMRQLIAAGLTPAFATAINDFPGGARLGVVTSAMSDPRIAQKLPGKYEAQLLAQVTTALRPYQALEGHLDGSGSFAQSRIDTAMVVARHNMANGATMEGAVAAAAKLWTQDQVTAGTWSMPQSAVPSGAHVAFDAQGRSTLTDGVGQTRAGASLLLGAVTANNGANLRQVAGSPPGIYAADVAHNAQWRNAPDGSGLVLMKPNTDATWTQVTDRFGRPVGASWQQLQAIGHGDLQPSSLFAPPPHTPVAPSGQPVPAASRQQAMNAVIAGITQTESHGVNGQVSPQGAMGVMQVLPSTAAPIAQRLFGQPLDLHRLQFDPAYNTRIGSQIVADAVNHYGPSAGGIALTFARYHDGVGNVDGYTDAKGYHPGLIDTYGDPRQMDTGRWTAAIAARAPKTSDYVAKSAANAYDYLTRNH